MIECSYEQIEGWSDMAKSSTTQGGEELPGARSVLAVCAHPDDESFGLGATLASFDESGVSTAVLCLTHGEASTLGADSPELGRVRAAELAAAAKQLGVGDVELLHYHDGRLREVPLVDLTARVLQAVQRSGADLLLVFDEGGITGHPDHRRATEAAVAVARELGLPVLAWTLLDSVANTLNVEFGAGFVGRSGPELDLLVRVDRQRQRRAIDQHVSQATNNPVLGRRLELQGEHEAFRWLLPPR
jgi:LmbE family N-acetylglucosaminyl deacetylase